MKPIKNAELLMIRQDIKLRFDKVLLDLKSLPEIKHDYHALLVCEKFRPCLNMTNNPDIANLPFCYEQSIAQTSNKIFCVLSRISYTMQRFWELDEKQKVIEINRNLEKLEGYVENGLDAYKIVGEKFNPGFWLEKK